MQPEPEKLEFTAQVLEVLKKHGYSVDETDNTFNILTRTTLKGAVTSVRLPKQASIEMLIDAVNGGNTFVCDLWDIKFSKTVVMRALQDNGINLEVQREDQYFSLKLDSDYLLQAFYGLYSGDRPLMHLYRLDELPFKLGDTVGLVLDAGHTFSITSIRFVTREFIRQRWLDLGEVVDAWNKLGVR